MEGSDGQVSEGLSDYCVCVCVCVCGCTCVEVSVSGRQGSLYRLVALFTRLLLIHTQSHPVRARVSE